jgi:hypothetical protein
MDICTEEGCTQRNAWCLGKRKEKKEKKKKKKKEDFRTRARQRPGQQQRLETRPIDGSTGTVFQKPVAKHMLSKPDHAQSL